MIKFPPVLLALLIPLALTGCKDKLGERIFFDTNLSSPPGQSCASCHDPAAGFADPNQDLPVSRGAHPDRFGNRNAPTVAYAAFAPAFHYDDISQRYLGGQFLDGRAADLVEQAKGPLLNPLEMANPDKASIIEKIRNADYAWMFERVYGKGSLNNVETAFDQVADALAAFQQTEAVSPFSSKFDAYIAGKVQLTDQEMRGFLLFDTAKCGVCHDGQLFTDYSYRNLGVPRNPDNPFYNLPPELNPDGMAFVDVGLGANPAVLSVLENGKFKVPTLRNVALTGPYMHNGVFQTLEEVVDFYNTRDIDPKWAPPEVSDNMEVELMGNLGLAPGEVADLVAFLGTLSDGYVVPQ